MREAQIIEDRLTAITGKNRKQRTTQLNDLMIDANQALSEAESMADESEQFIVDTCKRDARAAATAYYNHINNKS